MRFSPLISGGQLRWHEEARLELCLLEDFQESGVQPRADEGPLFVKKNGKIDYNTMVKYIISN